VLPENVNDGVMVGVPETCCDDVTELVGDSLPVSELVSSKLSVMEGEGEGVAESVGDKDLVPDALSSSVSDSVTLLDVVRDGVTESVGDADASDVGLQKEGEGDTENVGVSERVTVPTDRDALSVAERDVVREMSSDWDSVDEGIKESLNVGLIVRDGDSVSVGVTVLDSNTVLLVLLDFVYVVLLECDIVSDEEPLDETEKVLLSLLESLNEYDVDVEEEKVVEALSTVADRSFEPERLHVAENESDLSLVDESDGESLMEADCDRLWDASVEGLIVGVKVLDWLVELVRLRDRVSLACCVPDRVVDSSRVMDGYVLETLLETVELFDDVLDHEWAVSDIYKDLEVDKLALWDSDQERLMERVSPDWVTSSETDSEELNVGVDERDGEWDTSAVIVVDALRLWELVRVTDILRVFAETVKSLELEGEMLTERLEKLGSPDCVMLDEPLQDNESCWVARDRLDDNVSVKEDSSLQVRVSVGDCAVAVWALVILVDGDTRCVGEYTTVPLDDPDGDGSGDAVMDSVMYSVVDIEIRSDRVIESLTVTVGVMVFDCVPGSV
jgi:hypothetical protein